MKNLTIEVYSKNFGRKSCLAHSLNEVKSFLTSIDSNINIDRVILSLEEQTKDSSKFPNAIFFLDKENNTIYIDEFMK